MSEQHLQAAILAAGEGNRISPQFGELPKSLVSVGNITLIGFQLRALEISGFDKVAVVIRKQHSAVIDFLQSVETSLCIDFVTRDTMGGMYSLLAVSSILDRDSDFFLFSVDNVFDPQSLKHFVSVRRGEKDPDIVTWIQRNKGEDENPVGIILDGQTVVNFGKHLEATEYIAEGPYHCQRSVLNSKYVKLARRTGITRLSDYFGLLVRSGLVMKIHLVENVLDVDTTDDVVRAKEFLRRLSF